MQVVSVDELVNQKILPFDLYNEDGEKIFSAGEVLTPGKLLQLRYISVIYKQEFEDEELEIEEEIEEPILEEEPEEIEEPDEYEEEETEEDSEYADEIIEKFEEAEPSKEVPLPESSVKKKEKKPIEYEKIEKQEEKVYIEEYHLSKEDDVINEFSQIPAKAQKTIKSSFNNAYKLNSSKKTKKDTSLLIDARDRIVDEILPIVNDVSHRSQLKILGSYDHAHSLNVSILSTMLASKLKLNDSQISDISLAGMLHDIGKTRIPKEVLEKNNPSSKEQKVIQLHSQVGYRIIKKELNLSEQIAKVALNHHERNDGSGYPYGISGDLISLYTQIVVVCNEYDKLTSNKGHVRVKNVKEALKVMLEIGSRWFNPHVLYTFIHMCSYNDTMSFDQ